MSEVDLIEGRDYTIEDGRWVFTAAYLLRRGHCCQCGCRHCPYRKATPEASRPRHTDPPAPATQD